jgi:tmRNA-binding protein
MSPHAEGTADEKTVASNRKARHDYAFLERFEAGIALTGSEVKSLRQGRASLAEAYARFSRGEAWLENMNPALRAGREARLRSTASAQAAPASQGD